jgi:hypothetical protein
VDRNLAVAVDSCGVIGVTGIFERHVSPTVRELTGSSSGGRWGSPGAYSVLYLGRPTDSVIVEAYRHLVDDTEGMAGSQVVLPRKLLRASVNVSTILDLRDSANQAAVGLSDDDLRTYPGNYARCQRVGQAAHQLGLHGVIAPAATRLGETLALFELHLPADEQPELVGEEDWLTLPPDPRVPRPVPT